MAKASENSAVAKINWLDDVAAHDYEAASNYLSLKMSDADTGKLVAKLKKAKLESRRANDILRSANRDPAPIDDPGVMKDLVKVINGKRLSPVLAVRTAAGTDIADGYHRVSLVYRLNPYGEIPLKIA